MIQLKISDLEDFVGKKTLLEAQEIGVRVCGKNIDAVSAMVIGLASILEGLREREPGTD